MVVALSMPRKLLVKDVNQTSILGRWFLFRNYVNLILQLNIKL